VHLLHPLATLMVLPVSDQLMSQR